MCARLYLSRKPNMELDLLGYIYRLIISYYFLN